MYSKEVLIELIKVNKDALIESNPEKYSEVDGFFAVNNLTLKLDPERINYTKGFIELLEDIFDDIKELELNPQGCWIQDLDLFIIHSILISDSNIKIRFLESDLISAIIESPSSYIGEDPLNWTVT